MTESHVHTGDVRLHYRIHGTGPKTLVFIHGNLGSMNWWNLVLPLLPEDVTAVAFDLRGCGLSSKPEPQQDYENYSFDQHATDLERAIDELGIDEYELVVHSTGGIIGLRLALRSPQRCTGIFALDPVGPQGVDLTESMEVFQRARDDPAFASTLLASTMPSVFQEVDLTSGEPAVPKPDRDPEMLALIERLARERHSASDGIWFGFARQLTREYVERPLFETVSGIEVPVTVVWGELDRWIRKQDMEELVGLLPLGRFVEVPGRGQSLQVEDPGLFAELLLAHLGRSQEKTQRS